MQSVNNIFDFFIHNGSLVDDVTWIFKSSKYSLHANLFFNMIQTGSTFRSI